MWVMKSPNSTNVPPVSSWYIDKWKGPQQSIQTPMNGHIFLWSFYQFWSIDSGLLETMSMVTAGVLLCWWLYQLGPRHGWPCVHVEIIDSAPVLTADHIRCVLELYQNSSKISQTVIWKYQKHCLLNSPALLNRYAVTRFYKSGKR